MTVWLAKQLVRCNLPLLVVAFVVACASWPLSTQLRLDWAVESLFPPGDPLVESYRKLQTRFSGNDICLVAYRDPNLWNEDGAGLDRLAEVSRQLAAVDGVQAVLSLAELHDILEKLRGPLRLFSSKPARPPLLDPDDKLAQEFAKVFEGYTHRRDGLFVAIACILSSDTAQSTVAGPQQHESTIASLRAIMAELPEPASDGFVTGEPVLVAEGFKLLERDGWRLGITSSVLVSAVLLFCFRSLRWTLIPLVVVHWSLLVTQAILVVLNLELTMISSTLTAMVTVIGVATAMHLLIGYQSQRRSGHERGAAMQTALASLIAPIFWACVTDAVGFCALLGSRVGPVRDFGLMMATGAMCVFLAILLLVPGLALVGRFDADPSTPRMDFAIRLFLRRVLNQCLAHRRMGLGLLAAIILVSWWGSQQMRIETDFTKNFRQDSVLMRGYSIIEEDLGGAGVWDIMLPAPRSITEQYINIVAELENQLRDLTVQHETGSPMRLRKVLSIADAVQAAEAGPLLAALPTSARIQGMRTAMPDFTSVLLTTRPDQAGLRWLRIMLRSSEQENASIKAELIKSVQGCLDQFTQRADWQALFTDPPPPAEIAGYHVMLGRLVASVLQDQWRCFMIAACGIFVVMTLATRSLWLGALALIPNALPILIVLAAMGFLGIRANMGVAMIAAVSLGLSIDSSIHYLLHYRRQLKAGASSFKALRSAQENVGLAVVLATAALVAGFASLCTSEFVPTVVFGMLSSLTMIGSVFGNLVILPLLVGDAR